MPPKGPRLSPQEVAVLRAWIDAGAIGPKDEKGTTKTVASTHWSFQPIGADRGTRVELTIRFEFANPMLNLLLARSFEKSCNELVDAFVARARAVYGTR